VNKALALAAAALVLAGCASAPSQPEDELVWSSRLARSLSRETGEVVEIARFSTLNPGAGSLGQWEPYVMMPQNARTQYHLVNVDGAVALEADAPEGGSGLYRKIRIDPKTHPILEWRWRLPRQDSPESWRSSPPALISLGIDGDPTKLDILDRIKLRMAKAMTATGLPYASLLYVWRADVPVGTVLRSPHTDRVRMIVVESGDEKLDQWVSVRRNVAEDYRLAFGEEPGDIVAIGVLTDVGDDGTRRRAYYGDITARQSSSTAPR
jgi:hypothetical protein